MSRADGQAEGLGGDILGQGRQEGEREVQRGLSVGILGDQGVRLVPLDDEERAHVREGGGELHRGGAVGVPRFLRSGRADTLESEEKKMVMMKQTVSVLFF